MWSWVGQTSEWAKRCDEIHSFESIMTKRRVIRMGKKTHSKNTSGEACSLPRVHFPPEDRQCSSLGHEPSIAREQRVLKKKNSKVRYGKNGL